MLVYGDHSETLDARLELEKLRSRLAGARNCEGLDRHSRLVGGLVEGGRIAQGLADADHVGAESLMAFICELASCILRSWDSRFQDSGDWPDPPSIGSPAPIELRLAEGFAYYAVYPEAYAEAARRLALSGPPRVIGIRSIGTTLGAVAAAALEAPAPITVRPSGDCSARQVELPATVLDDHAHYVIVDEGPGLSGSSFGSVADWLEDHGIPPERIAFITSHDEELGLNASARHRQRWLRAQRVPATFAFSFLADDFGPLEECRGNNAFERLKFLGQSQRGKVLLSFAGLGSIGERKLQMSRALHSAGLTPEPLGLIHGFLAERWHDDALCLAPEDKPVLEIGQYIGTRARLFPAGEDAGATIEDLVVMCRRNASLALGQDAAGALDRWNAGALSLAVHRVRTDNRLDRSSWLRLSDGHLLKTDAVDHHCAHDLIGCQDPCWDVAGAIIEFALDDEEACELVRETEKSVSRPLSAALIDFYQIAYSCFRLGQARLAGELCTDSGESGRLSSRAVRYETALMPMLKEDYCCFTSQKSLVD